MTASKGSGIRVVVFDERDKILPFIRKAMFESVASFNQLPSCMSFVEENTLPNEAAVIVTTSIEDLVLKTFEASKSIEAVFIFSTKRRDVDKLPNKVVGIYSQINDLLLALFETLDTIQLQLNGNSFLFHREENGSDNIDFYFYNLWLSHDINQKLTTNDLVEQANIYFRSKKQIKTAIHEFDTTYNRSYILRWLNRHDHPFPYHLLVSNALRTHDQTILALVRFFIFDLSRQMKSLTSIHVCNQTYYGTKLPLAMVDRLEHQTSEDIIAFQCFLPATKSRLNALALATRPSRRRQVASVLFKIDASNAFGVHMGDIILIDMATPFRITSVSRYGDLGSAQQLVTIVQLVAIDQVHKQQLHKQFIQKQKIEGKTIEDFILQTVPLLKVDNSHKRRNSIELDSSRSSIPPYVVSTSPVGRRSPAVCDDEAIADEFMSRDEWTQALEALSRIDNPNVRVLNKIGCLLREHFNSLPGGLELHQQALMEATDREKATTHMYLGIVYNDMKQPDEALQHYSQALQWYENEKPRDPAVIARCLVGLGNAYWACGQLDKALDCAERALLLREQAVEPKNDFDIAGCLGNMGNILHDQGNMERALSCAQRAADILSKCGKGDPRLAAALNNLGAMYQVCGDYGKAREYFEQALDSIPDENHPYRTSILNNIARLIAVERAQT